MSAKILVYFLIIALVPLILVSYVLVTSAYNQLLDNASDKQRAVAADLSQRVDSYLGGNINQLAYIARLYNGSDISHLDSNFKALFNQNADLTKVVLILTNGQTREYKTTASLTTDEKSDYTPITPELSLKTGQVDVAALDFIAGKSYLLSSGRDEENKPQLTVAIPILKKYGAATHDLISSPIAKAGQQIGAIQGFYDLSNLWDSVLSTKLGTGGYAYVVDGTVLNNLMVHPDPKFLSSHKELAEVEAVRQFSRGDNRTKPTISETSEEVISTPHKTETGWAVIVEEPVSSIYSKVNSYIQLSATVGISAILLSILAGIFFGRQLIRPLRQLTQGARRIEKGDFDQSINIKTNDELQELAETFNNMAQSIKKLISDLKTNNFRLKFEQIKLNNIISSVSDGVVAVNNKGEIISINPPAAKLIGKKPEDLHGHFISDVFGWEHEGERFTPDLKNGGIYRYPDLVLYRKDSVAYLDLMVAVLDHPSSDMAAIITIHDQTESRELSFMKLDFVAIAAHELRTPLTVVRGYLDMLSVEAAKELSAYNFESLHKAIVGADQLRNLINKLLNIARIERGDMEIFPERLNLTELVDENVNQHQSVASQKEQKIELDSDPEHQIYVVADTASIVEVLNNLIGNALKYTPKGGTINVKISATDLEARVEVTDNGPGIPEEMRDRLFTKFYRAERSLIAGSRGTGLGLYISKTIIELQNGRIGIESTEGEGSTFYFTLPIYNAERDEKLLAKKSTGGIRGWFKKHPSR